MNYYVLKQHNMTFHASDGTLVATLDFNGPELVFTGNADEAAKIFVEAMAKYMKARLAEEYTRGLEAGMNV